ncbi:MAG: hypothetical protein ACMUJM_16490 [bacterium]
MKKISLTRRNVEMGLFLGGVALITLYLFLFQLPLYRKLKILLNERKAYMENNISGRSISQKSNQLRKIRRKESKIKEEIQSLGTHFSHTGLFLWDIMHNIGTLAKELRINVIITKPDITQETEKFHYSTLKIKLSGKFMLLYRFIFLLEKYTPAIKFTSFTIEMIDEKRLCEGDLILNLFTPRAGQPPYFEEHDKGEKGIKVSSFTLAGQVGDQQWPEHIERDIFEFEIQRRTFFPTRHSEKTLRLEATFTGGQPMAVINNQPLAIGDTIAGYQLKEVQDRLVILTKDGKNTTLKLKE